MVGGGDPFYCWSTVPCCSEIADFQPIIARSAAASSLTPSERSSVDTNRKSTTRFPISLTWSPYTLPLSPKGGSKTQNGHFPSKMKLFYKVSLCENCQRQCCKAKTIEEGQPFLSEILVQTHRVGAKSSIFDVFSPVAPQPQHLAKKVQLTLREVRFQ